MEQASATLKDEFRNTTKGFVGVIIIDPKGQEKGIAVRADATVWLTEGEQILTANAPRSDADNPFANGNLELVTKAKDIKNRRPIGNQQQAPNGNKPQKAPAEPSGAEGNQENAPEAANARAKADAARKTAEAERRAAAKKQAEAGARPTEETGAAVSPSGTPKQGQRAPAEEVATPEAPAAKE